MRRKKRELEAEITRHQGRLDTITQQAALRNRLVLKKKDEAGKRQYESE
jgi:hypothetical protein